MKISTICLVFLYSAYEYGPGKSENIYTAKEDNAILLSLDLASIEKMSAPLIQRSAPPTLPATYSRIKDGCLYLTFEKPPRNQFCLAE